MTWGAVGHHVHDCPECGAWVRCSIASKKYDHCPGKSQVCDFCLIRLSSVDQFNGDSDSPEAGW